MTFSVSREQIFTEIADIIREVLELPDLRLDDATSAENVAGWDSFNHINIVLAVEAHFGIRFHTTEVEELKTAGELVDLVRDKLRARTHS